jgi:transcriptional regulator, AraC family
MNSDVGFTCQQLEKDEVYRIDNSKSSCTLFIIEGDVIFDLGKYKGLRILQNQMVFIPQNIGTRMKSITGSKCMLLFWDRNMSVCDKLFLGSLSARGEDRTADNFILPVRKPLAEVLDSVGMYLEARLLCKHMHLLKQQELLLVLKGFYTKKELTAFFSASTGIRQRFEKFVMENYKKVNSVKEFADLYYVSERSFSRKFHSCFGESPYKWMQKKRAEQMLEMICDPELSFQEISGRLGFSSPSHFTAYCRRMYGMSPTQLREKNKK